MVLSKNNRTAMKPELSAQAKAKIENIASTILNISTLEARNSDRLDFYDLAVWSVKEALEAAYLAGNIDHMK